MDDFVPDQGIKDSQRVVWMIHKCRQGEFTQATRDKQKENGKDPSKFKEMLSKNFTASDADADGFLNEDEFIVFRKKITDIQAQMNGEGVTIPEDIDRKIWKHCKEYFTEGPGLSMKDVGQNIQTFRTFGMSPECKYRLWYFEGLYGRGEPIRLLLTHAGIPWEDLQVNMNEWTNLKASAPGGTLPLLEMQNGNLKGGATRATMRYLSLTYGYYPDDPMQAQQCDMIVDAFQDEINKRDSAAFGAGFDPSTIPEHRPKYYDQLNTFLKFVEPYAAKGQFLCGPKLCTADFWVGGLVFACFENPIIPFGKKDNQDEGENNWDQLYAKYPGFAGWAKRFVAANKKRMDTRSPCGF